MVPSTIQVIWSTIVKHTPSPLTQGLPLLLVAASLLKQGALEFRGSHLEKVHFLHQFSRSVMFYSL